MLWLMLFAWLRHHGVRDLRRNAAEQKVELGPPGLQPIIAIGVLMVSTKFQVP